MEKYWTQTRLNLNSESFIGH